jgi:hypothetical protein
MKRHGIHPVRDIEGATVRVEPPPDHSLSAEEVTLPEHGSARSMENRSLMPRVTTASPRTIHRMRDPRLNAHQGERLVFQRVADAAATFAVGFEIEHRPEAAERPTPRARPRDSAK